MKVVTMIQRLVRVGVLIGFVWSTADAFQMTRQNARSVRSTNSVWRSSFELHRSFPSGTTATVPPRSASMQLFPWSKAEVDGVAENNDTDESVSDESPSALNAFFGAAWVLLVGIAFAFAPGTLNGPEDMAMLQQILADPVNPGLNELFYTLFNVFLPLPVILAALVLPQGSSKGIPAGPALVGSAFLGYFSLGPYLALRASPRTTIDDQDTISSVTQQLEQKSLAWSLVLLLLALPLAAHVPEALSTDHPEDVWNGFVGLVSTSRFASVSCLDLTLLHVASVALIPADYQLRRQPNSSSSDDNSEPTGVKIAAAAFLAPFVGPALYCALRPSLPGLSREGCVIE